MKGRVGELAAAMLESNAGSVLELMQPFIFQCQVVLPPPPARGAKSSYRSNHCIAK